MEMVTFLTPATLRPEIIRRTFKSFSENMLCGYKRKRAVLNIDLIGEDVPWSKALWAAAAGFRHTEIKIGKKPNFARAFKWLWEQTKTKYTFWLEDDWELLTKIDLAEMVAVMDKHPQLATLRLPYTPTAADHYKSWSHIFPWTGDYFKCPDEDRNAIGYCGHPSLYRTSFMKEVLPLVKTNMCPEKQIKGRLPKMREILNRWDLGVFSKPNQPPVIRDIGREWRDSRGLNKDSTIYFTSWQKKGT